MGGRRSRQGPDFGPLHPRHRSGSLPTSFTSLRHPAPVPPGAARAQGQDPPHRCWRPTGGADDDQPDRRSPRQASP